uniref:DNA-(apurinic or apyrimidinic site) endonuclease n=1 Tax=Calcidiscus leptoporus TaxID=127549 RepID=A0A7S0NXS7_9EUKA
MCLMEHKLQPAGASSADAKARLEQLATECGYGCTWTFSPRAGFDGLVALTQAGTPPPVEPPLSNAACAQERRLLALELDSMHVVLAYVPNSGRPGRLAFRLEQWEPSVRALLSDLQRSGKPLLYQGDLNVAHERSLDAWGTTAAQFGGFKASGRTREEAEAFEQLLDKCGLVDGFRFLHPSARSATCWAQKRAGEAEQREHWKRYDYALVSEGLARGSRQLQLTEVRHRGDAFGGGRPDHVPIESVFALCVTSSALMGGSGSLPRRFEGDGSSAAEAVSVRF